MIARLLAVALLAGTALAQNVVHYTTTTDNVKYLFATAEPVARLKSGDILDTNTLDCFGNALRKPGDTLSMAKGDNPLAGPFYVEGAEPGDTLAVKILDLQVDGDTGVGAFGPGFGALNGTHYTPVLEPPLTERIWYYHIDHAADMATFKAIDSDFSVKIPMHPFFGCIGVAPANGEARSSIVPAEFGGNMDSPEASVGNTVYFPVNVKGGLFYIGDGHAAMGDGEVAGSAIEVPLKARVQLSVIKGRKIDWPQFENDDAIMTVGAYRPLDDALRIAFTELVHWIHKDYGLSDLDAYELLSKVAKIHLNEMVDPNYVVVASIEKKYLPARKAEKEAGSQGLSAGAAPRRIRVGAGVSQGLLIRKVNPEYPPAARAAGVQGTVILTANIDREGKVYKLTPVSGPEELIPAAMEAVKQWVYKPFLLAGEPVEVETTIQVNFTLKG